MRLNARKGAAAAVVVGLLAATGLVPIRTAVAHRGFTLESLAGRWSALEEWETAGQYHTSVGIYTFDGKGGCSLKYIVNDPTASGRQHWEKTTCTYDVHPDGRGELGGGVTPQNFVITSHGRKITYVFNSPGIVGKGEMSRM